MAYLNFLKDSDLIPVLATNTVLQRISEKFDKNFDKLQQFMSMNFKKAMLMMGENPKQSTWFIFWYNFNPKTNKLQRIRKTFDLNRIDNIELRKKVADEIVNIINAALANGYNYFDDNVLPTFQISKKPSVHDRQFPKIVDALNYALKIHSKKLGSTRSVGSYKSALNVFFGWLKDADLIAIPTTDFTPKMAIDYTDFRLGSGIVGKTCNVQNGFLHKLFEVLRRAKEIDVNPFADMERSKEIESNVFEAYTQDELVKIADYLQKVNPRFFLFTQHIYYQFSRPSHIAKYQRFHYDFERNLLTPFGETTKSKKRKEKQLMQPIKDAMLAFGLDKLPMEWYVFGKGFMPSEKPYSSTLQRADELWKRYVHHDLGINKKMYALKHTGGQFYVNMNNADAAWLQSQMEHHNLVETETYIRSRVTKKIDENNLNMPEFK